MNGYRKAYIPFGICLFEQNPAYRLSAHPFFQPTNEAGCFGAVMAVQPLPCTGWLCESIVTFSML